MGSEVTDAAIIATTFPPLEDRSGSSFERLTPPKPFTNRDVGDINAKHYYFQLSEPNRMVEPAVLRGAAQAVAHFIPDTEHGYIYPAGGTCFFVGNFLITQAHCVMGEGLGPIEERRIVLPTGEEVNLAEIKPKFVPKEYGIGRDDIAIYDISQIEALRFVPILGLAQNELQVDDPIFSIGYPWVIDNGMTEVMSYGTVQEVLSGGMFIYDCETTQGQSGGPLVNKNGEVVGMVWQAAPDAEIGQTQSRIIGLSVSRIRQYLQGNYQNR